MEPIRVLQWGLGAMGSGMVRLMLEKSGIKVVAVIDSRPDYVGKDLGDVLGIGKKLGVIITDKPADVLKKEAVDVAVLATTSWVSEQMGDLRKVITAGINCISIAEEMADPYAQSPALAAELDQLAKKHGISVLGTGVNPGFVLDLLVVLLSGGNHRVERIEASRINDLSPYGPTVMRTQGVGTTPEAFRAGVADGSIVGHVGFPESIHMISDALGLGVDRIEQSREPIISKVRRETPHVVVEPGMVAGCAHIGVGYCGDKEVIRLIHPQQIHPQLENQDTGDYINIYGLPEIHMAIKPEIAGGKATMGIAVNMIPHVFAATPGLKRMIDLPVPAALMGESAYTRHV
ncbi:MAG TPA: 2,4-diaminopentanoate dehydrogenase [Anaerolineaceae bacterium]|nr:2,4-diaminopentanoate dehydrogenase [Anaerolineaceae bacterium]HNZ12524.1 2,4-diaminopentanoate dehydrogenase [Anaerolineaceae bacterium]HOD04339.1 2,4-diaminopentanoate dehydrogenase [Anaerolineaceae bacterium]